MPRRPLIIYYECLDNGIDASYSTILDNLENNDVHFASLDSFSDAYQMHVATTGLSASSRSLIIVDSRNGKTITGLISLLNLLRTNDDHLLWLGKHDFADKAIAMVGGQRVSETQLKGQLISWIHRS